MAEAAKAVSSRAAGGRSDVDASRPAAGIGYSRLQSSEGFQCDFFRTRQEFRRLTVQSSEEFQRDFFRIRPEFRRLTAQSSEEFRRGIFRIRPEFRWLTAPATKTK